MGPRPRSRTIDGPAVAVTNGSENYRRLWRPRALAIQRRSHAVDLRGPATDPPDPGYGPGQPPLCNDRVCGAAFVLARVLSRRGRMEGQPLLPIVIGSAAVAAVISGVFQLAAEALRRRAAKEDRMAKLDADVQARREKAHEAARDELLPPLLDALSFLDEQYRTEVEDQLEVSVVAYPVPTGAVKSWNEVLGVLDRISLKHPDSGVREKARSNERHIQKAFVDPGPWTASKAELERWMEDIRKLVESMHV